MCIMKDVDPFAASLFGVMRLSSSVATKMSVKSGHQPGNGKRTDHTAAPQIAAAAVTRPTNRYNRVWRRMSNRYWDPGLPKLAPGQAFTFKQTGEEPGHCRDQTAS
jgi:hypothetical protein